MFPAETPRRRPKIEVGLLALFFFELGSGGLLIDVSQANQILKPIECSVIFVIVRDILAKWLSQNLKQVV